MNDKNFIYDNTNEDIELNITNEDVSFVTNHPNSNDSTCNTNTFSDNNITFANNKAFVGYKNNISGKKYATDKEIYTLDSIDKLQDASGVLDNDYFIYDIDDMHICHKFDKLLKELKVVTQTVITSRGKHYYFKRDRNVSMPSSDRRAILNCGIDVELKTREIVIKQNNIERTIINANIFSVIQPFLACSTFKNEISLCKVSEGSRNDSFYKFVKNYDKKMLLQDNRKRYLRLINDIVLDEPLQESEFNSVTRVEENKSFEKSFHSIEDIINKYSIVRVNGVFYFKIDGKYTNNTIEFFKDYLCFNRVHAHSTATLCSSILNALEYLVPNENRVLDIVKFNNGYLDSNCNFIYGEYNDICEYTLPYTYNKDAKPTRAFNSLLDTISRCDKEYKELLKMCITYPVIRNIHFIRKHPKIFFFVGSGKNGKSAFLSMLENYYKNYTESISLGDISKPVFLRNLVSKMLNLCNDDTSTRFDIAATQALKTVSAADTVTVKELYKQPYTAYVTPCLIGSTNSIITNSSNDTGLFRRLVWFPTLTKISDKMIEDYPNFSEELNSPETFEYITKLIIEMSHELFNNKFPKESVTVENFNKQYREETNNFYQFFSNYYFDLLSDNELKDDTLKLDLLHKTPVSIINEAYKSFCCDNGFKEVGKQKRDEVLNSFGYACGTVKINNTSVWGLKSVKSLLSVNTDLILERYEHYKHID